MIVRIVTLLVVMVEMETLLVVVVEIVTLLVGGGDGDFAGCGGGDGDFAGCGGGDGDFAGCDGDFAGDGRDSDFTTGVVINAETGKSLYKLTEMDVPGASLNGREPSQLHVVELKRWLKCRGATTSGRKEELVKR